MTRFDGPWSLVTTFSDILMHGELHKVYKKIEKQAISVANSTLKNSDSDRRQLAWYEDWQPLGAESAFRK